MWLEDDIMELREVGGDLGGYEFGEYGCDWRIAGWHEP